MKNYEKRPFIFAEKLHETNGEVEKASSFCLKVDLNVHSEPSNRI